MAQKGPPKLGRPGVPPVSRFNRLCAVCYRVSWSSAIATSFSKCLNKRMERHELILRMVLNELCDDFENVDQIILPHLAEHCCKLGLAIERPEVVKVVAGLV